MLIDVESVICLTVCLSVSVIFYLVGFHLLSPPSFSLPLVCVICLVCLFLGGVGHFLLGTKEMDKTTGIMASSTNKVMEKPLHQDQQPLKCPRCDSLNTKFCYYNNYSLSQPRYFCKACKRYWTRGGTLRNVPVGGGYRKNKKMKKTSSSGNDSAPQQNPIISSSLSHHQLDNIATSHLSPMFYGLPGNSYTEFPFQRFSSRNSYPETLPASGPSYEEYGGSGFNHATQFQDMISSSNSIFSNLSLLGSSASSPAYASGSLISLQQQKQAMGGKDTRPTSNFHGQLIPYEGLQMVRNGDATMVMDEVKMEEGYRKANRMEWAIPCLNQTELVGASDAATINWNSTSGSAWPGLSNYGSSVTPLI